jgi:hypothetical protein
VSSWKGRSRSVSSPARTTSRNSEEATSTGGSIGRLCFVSVLLSSLADSPLLSSSPQHHGHPIRSRHPTRPPRRLAAALRKPTASLQSTMILGRFLAQDRRSLPSRVRSFRLSTCLWIWIWRRGFGCREVFRCVLGLCGFGCSSCPREPKS